MSARTDPLLGYASEHGRNRAVNQDKLGFYRPDDLRLSDLAGSIYVVADGAGSGERGTALADQTIRTLVRSYYGAVRAYGRADALASAFLVADHALREALTDQPDPAAGVTAVAVVVRGDELIVGHVGDARAYLVRDGRAFRLTDDASDGTAQLGKAAALTPSYPTASRLGRPTRSSCAPTASTPTCPTTESPRSSRMAPRMPVPVSWCRGPALPAPPTT